LLFNFGFEDVELVQDGPAAFFEGTDGAYEDHNDWGDWAASEDGQLLINYEAGDSSQRIAQIVEDPEDPENSVLHFKITSPNGPKGDSRVQLDFVESTCLQEYYQTVRVYFPSENMEVLKQYSSGFDWFSLFTFWNNASWSGERYPFQVSIGLHKESGEDKDISFRAHAQKEKYFGETDDLWIATSGFPLPLGKWMLIDLYILEGDSKNGRVVMGLTVDGGERKEIFDIVGYTGHPDESCADGFTHLQPMQLYTSADLVEYMAVEGESLDVYWDDWVVTRNWNGQSR
jgi:hypothetical protein